MKHATRIFHFASLLMCFLFAASFSSYADGSKDIYPDGVKGGRARLRASTASSASYPFPTLGTHYVYAKAGEVIAIASSTQGVAASNAANVSRLILTGPDGSMIVSHQTPRTGAGSEVGKIPDRNAEKLGPHLPNQADGGYTPYYYEVPGGAEGIYKVEFISNGGETSTTTQRQSDVYGYADWAQNNSSATIAAWDISISNAAKNAWQKGRVYANILNMDIDAGFKDNYNFYGQLKILTKDGYTYNVKNNGNNGISFTFFVNNKGFVDTDGQPLYQSLNTTTGISDKIQNPTTEDTQSGITHKIFYTLPDPDLPQTANGAVPGGTTWLKNPRLIPTVENLNIVGVDGTVGQVSNKGGRIRFDANLAGRFKIEIASKVAAGNPGYFPTRAISGSALAGTNNVPWDGKDGAGVPLPNGQIPAILNIQLQGAEVHFPYFDMEINPNGMILELLNAQLNGVQSDIVYWDDSLILPARDIPSNPVNASQFIAPLGTSSSVNGHKWGSSSSPTSGTFADERSIDTWTFILGAKEIKEITVDVKEADLEVISIVPSKTIVTKGDELSYTVKVKNGGPSDVIGKKDPITGIYDNTGAPFTFKLPAGFVMGEMQFVSACGATEAVPVVFDPATGLYKSVLKLASGCEGQYVFKGTVGPAMVAGNMEVWATIMRPNDVTDIDATNPNPNVPPTNPYFECSAYDPLSGLAIPCNNIKKNNTATIINKITATKEINGNPAKVKAGDVLTYNIILENTNSTDKTGVTASDVLPAGLVGATAISHGGTLTGTTVTWTNLTVPANNKITLSFKTTVGPNSTGITSIRNVASVVDPIDPTTPLSPEVLVPVELVSSFTAVKKVTGGLLNNKITAGSEITYSIEVLNTGNTALANLEIADVIPNQMSYVTGTADNAGVLNGNTLNWVINVPVGQTKAVTFKVKVADNLTGVAAIKNIATVTDPAKPLTPVSPEVEVPTDPIRSFTAVKSVSAGLNNNKIIAGSTITYSIEVKNTGSTDLTGIKISDVVPDHTTYKTGTADNGGAITGSALNWTVNVPFGQTKTLTFQVEVAKDLTGVAAIKNVAAVTDPLTPTHPPVNPEVEVPTDPVKSFAATKKISAGLQNNKIVAGSTITYSIEVKNTGSTALTNIAIADNIPNYTTYVNGTANLGGSLTGSTLNWVVNLAFGESKTVSFQVKVADDLTGIVTIKNAAIVTDPTTPTHPPVIPEVEVPTDPVRSFTASKKISAGLQNNKIVAGSTITYSIEVKNTGSTALTNIAIADNIPANTTYVEGTANLGGGLTGNTLNWVVNLAFGESKTVSFQVKVADDLTGIATIKNAATVTDPTTPTHPPVIPEVEVPTDPVRSFIATKKISGGLQNNKIVAGSTITYSIEVKNTGSTALTNIAIADNIPGHTTYVEGTANLGGSLTGSTLNWVVNLAFGESKTVSFKVKVADNLTGIVTIKNVATVTDPTIPTNPPVIPEVEVPTDAKRSFTTAKRVVSGLVNGKVPSEVELIYAIDVVNTGGEDLIALNIADDLPTGTSFVRADQNGTASGNRVNWTIDVPFGQTKTVLLTLKVAADLSNVETIVNKAIVTDPKDPANPKVPEVTVTTEQKAAITLSKTAIAGDHQKVGEVVSYHLVLKNIGNVAVKNIIITDDNADAGSISPASIASLAPDATINITAKHTLIQEDLDRGYVSNLAKGDGKDPKNKEVHAESKDPSPVPGAPTDPACKDCTITPVIQKGALSLSKTAVAGAYNKVGGAINYNLVLENTGNVTLRNIVITDDNADAGSINPASIAILAPGATVNITAKHTLTQEDLDRGSVSNLAKADGKDPKNKAVHAESKDPSPIPGGPKNPDCKDCTVTPTEQLAGINLVKKITNKGSGEQDAFILNDQIEYTFVIKNTGNTTLTGITLNDPLLGASAIQIPGSLAPGASISHKEYYTITAADIAVGKVTNQARVTAKDPKGKEITAVSGTDAGNNNPTVIPLAKPPVAKDDLAKAAQNKPVKIEVQKNDEPGNSPIIPGSTRIITQPKNGTLTLSPDGTVTYTPNPGFTGTDEFVYTVTDKNGQISNPATVKVEVTPSKPVAMDDLAETEFNKEIEIPLLHNDKTDGAVFEKPTVEIIEQPKNGVLKKNPDGTVVYVPNSGFTGKDSFTYKVKDANGNWTNVATANITIKGFFIPNVITPNGDGKNDEFVIVGLEEFNSAELTIFNRWGNEVYRNGNYKNTWTGEGLNEGTYYYLIRLKKDGKLEVHKGWVLIKR